MCETKFYICEHCGNLIGMIHNAGVPVMCCGQKMTALTPNTTDAAEEKHVPVIAFEGTTVTVAIGEVEHPMLEAHYIEWIAIATDKKIGIKYLEPGEAPEAWFYAEEDEAITVYAYCNLHGLWKAEA
jgi:superoxide reductase